MARRNTGSIRKVRQGVFKITLDVSKDARFNDPAHRAEFERLAKRARLNLTVYGPREEAERKLHELQYQRDQSTPTSSWTLNEWLHYWLRVYVEAELRPSTVEDYRMQVKNYIAPMLGMKLLRDIKPHDVRAFQNQLKGKVGSSVVRKLRQVLSGALREAWNNDLIPANPVHKTKTPKLVQEKVVAPSVDRVQQLLADAGGDKHFPALYLIAHTGLRAGEVLGLTWEHIDVLGRTLRVRQAMVETGGGRFIAEPKSEKGRRDIPLDDASIDVLMAHRAQQDAHRERMGTRYRDQGLVFPTMYGGLNRTSTLLHALRKYAADLHTHQLRHFFATQLMEAGVALARVSALMGHSHIGVTAAIYIHPDADGDREAIALLSARLTASNVSKMSPETLETLLSDTD